MEGKNTKHVNEKTKRSKNYEDEKAEKEGRIARATRYFSIKASKTRGERKWEASIIIEMIKTAGGSNMKLWERRGMADRFVRWDTLTGYGGRQGKWAARVLNYSRVSQHAGNSLPLLFVSLIGEYLASEIYPNHDLEFRPPRPRRSTDHDSLDRYFSVTNIRWRVSLGRMQRSSVFIRFSIRARNVLSRSMQRFFFGEWRMESANKM